MGYERKTEKYSINLNVIFQLVSFDILPWSPTIILDKGHVVNLTLDLTC